MRALALALGMAVLVGACTDGEDAGPPPDPDSTSSTSLADYTGVVLPGVGGETTTTIDETGTARLVGSVSGPSGPLAAATVRIDRFVAGRVVRHDVLSGADGRWELRDVPGGRYRVRAFQAPVFAQPTAEVAFLRDGEEHSFDLRVEDQRGIVVRADAAPEPPLLDGRVNLVVLVAQRTVSPDGIVRSSPLSGTFVELTGLGRWVLRGDDTTATTGDTGTTSTTFFDGATSQGAVLSDGGQARFELACIETGAPGLALEIPVLVIPDPAPTPPGSGSTTTSAPQQQRTEVVELELPACIDPASTTTTSTSTSTTP